MPPTISFKSINAEDQEDLIGAAMGTDSRKGFIQEKYHFTNKRKPKLFMVDDFGMNSEFIQDYNQKSNYE